MLQPNDVVTINNCTCQYLGSVESDSSRYPVDLYMDVTDANNLKVHVELHDYGRTKYQVKNIKSVAHVQSHVRAALRAYEDYVIGLLDQEAYMNASETQFLQSWLLSSR